MKNFASILILSLFVSTLSSASGYWDHEQTRHYVHNSDLQMRSNWQFISSLLTVIKGNEKLLDIGSGDGRMSSLMANLLKRGEVVGIESNENMRNWAKNQYGKDEYPNLSFKEGSYLSIKEEEEFGLVTAFFSFNSLAIDKRDQALSVIYRALKPSGRLIMTIRPASDSNPIFAKAIEKTISASKWRKYFNNRKEKLKYETIEELKDRFDRSPFEYSTINFKASKDPFVDKTEFINWILGSVDFILAVPSKLRSQLANDIIDKYIELKPDAKANKVYYGEWGRIEIVAKKLYSSKVNSSIFGS